MKTGVRGPILAVALACIGEANAQTIVAEYEGNAYGVVALGRARLETKITDGRYDAVGTMQTVGLAALFGRALITARADGRIGAGHVIAGHYALDHNYRNARRIWDIDWTVAPVRVVSDPDIPYTGDIPPTEEQRRAGRDPVATLVAMSAHVAHTGRCDATFRVFDGLYVYDLTMRDKGAGRLRRGAIDLPVLRCRLTQKRIAGYTARSDLAKALPEAEISFAIDPALPIAIFTRFTSHLPLGAATISLARLERR